MPRRSLFVVGAGLAGTASIATVFLVREVHVWPNAKTSAGVSFLPSGMRISPVGRAHSLEGDMPLRMDLSEDGQKLLIVTGGFHHQGLTTLDLGTEAVAKTKSMTKC